MPKKKLTESEVAKTYEVVAGFDTSDVRREVGDFVYEKDFSEKDWKALVQMEAVKLAVEPVVLGEDETIVFERIEE